MKKIFKFSSVLFLLLAFIFTSKVDAQNGNNGNGNGNVDGDITGTNNIPGNNGNNKPVGNAGPGDNGGDSVPLDGGLAILLAGAAAFGIRKLRK